MVLISTMTTYCDTQLTCSMKSVLEPMSFEHYVVHQWQENYHTVFLLIGRVDPIFRSPKKSKLAVSGFDLNSKNL
jgi:hypothetical protein